MEAIKKMKKRIVSISIDKDVWNWFKAKHGNVSGIIEKLMRQHMYGYGDEKYDFTTLLSIYGSFPDELLKKDPVLFAKLYIASGEYKSDLMFDEYYDSDILILDNGGKPYFNFIFFKQVFDWLGVSVSASFLKDKLLGIKDKRTVTWNLYNHDLYDRCIEGLKRIADDPVVVSEGKRMKKYIVDKDILKNLLIFLDIIRTKIILSRK